MKTIRLNPEFFDSRQLVNNKHRISLTGAVSYPTLLRYFNGDGPTVFSGDVLYAILSKGFDMSREDIESLSFGDVFVVEDGDD